MQAVGKPMLYKKQGHQGHQIKIVALLTPIKLVD
jgi:hypothetical protein